MMPAPLARWFVGAFLELAGVDVVVVVVPPPIVADPFEAELYVLGFQSRYRRHVVLMAQDARSVPTFYGPAELVRALSRMPFEAIPYRVYAYGSSSSSSARPRDHHDVPWIDRVAPFSRVPAPP